MTRALSTATEDHLRVGLRLAMATAVAIDSEPETLRPADFVFGLFKEAMETLNKLPDRESGWLYCNRSLWPAEAYDNQDALVAYLTMLERIRTGEESADILVPKKLPSAKAIGRMEATFELWRFLRTRDKRKAWVSICRLAEGRLPTKRIAKLLHCSTRTVYDLKNAEVAAIAHSLHHLMPSRIEIEDAVWQPHVA